MSAPPDPARLVAEALPPLPPRRARVVVIAVGEAAIPMASGALSRWPDRIDQALAITLDLGEPSAADPRLAIRYAAYPMPDARSLLAGEEALTLAGALGAEDLLVALVSSGASALLAAPPAGMDLVEKQAIMATLLGAGAPMDAVNVVWRHLSRIKGGGLARAALPARVLTLLLDDGSAPHDLGSGPTVADPTTVDEARAVLARYAPAYAATPHLVESLKLDTPVPLVLPGSGVSTTFAAGARLRVRVLG